MPRQARIDAPGALHHIIILGIERKPIFKDSPDYQDFLERLGSLLTDTSTSPCAWGETTSAVRMRRNTGEGESDGTVCQVAGRGRVTKNRKESL
jgi:putative transposase